MCTVYLKPDAQVLRKMILSKNAKFSCMMSMLFCDNCQRKSHATYEQKFDF